MRNVYTITGRSYDENGITSDQPCFAAEIYIKFYQSKIIVAGTVIGSTEVQKREYHLSETTNDIRTYTSEKYSEYYLVDKDYEVQKVTLIKPYVTYGGNITTKVYSEVIKGRHLAKAIKRCQDQRTIEEFPWMDGY